jgi:chromosome segregation ATPase
MKIQTFVRMYSERTSYRKLKSATISLQCRHRLGVAKREYVALKREQKDIGKLKENNERLKLEMASLKAMLAAQAKEDASRQESEKELREKDKEIAHLKKRISLLESELEKSTLQIQKLQSELSIKEVIPLKDMDDIKDKKQNHHREQENLPQTGSPTPSHAGRKTSQPRVLYENNHVSSDDEVLKKLQTALEAEREARRAADSEIIKLRAKMNGVDLNAAELDALLPSAKINLNDILDRQATVAELEMDRYDKVDADGSLDSSLR